MTPLQVRCIQLEPVIKAGAEGKAIQARMPGGREWIDKTTTEFIDDRQYRVKPEPKYRPFTPREAVMESGAKIKNKTHGHTAELSSVTLSTVVINGCSYCTFDDLLKHWTCADGKPCGVSLGDY